MTSSQQLQDTINYTKFIETDTANQEEVIKAKEIIQQNLIVTKLEKSESSELSPKEKLKIASAKTAKLLLNLLIVKGKSLHGNAYVEDELKQQSSSLAYILTGTNLINIITSSPIIFIAGKSAFLYPLPSIVINILLLLLLNKSGTQAASKSPNQNIPRACHQLSQMTIAAK